jgi:glutamate transport system substrate-binding protein
MQKLHTRVLALVLGLVLVFAGACGDDDDGGSGATTTAVETFPAGSTMARLQSQGTAKVGVKFDQPGFGLKNPTTGAVEGFDVEIAKLIVEAIDPEIEITFIESVTANRQPFIKDGTVDFVVATYTINAARKLEVDFAGPYFEAQQDIMVKADDTTIKGVSDLNGKKVCTVKDSTSHKNLVDPVIGQAKQAQVTLFPTYSQCAEALTDGRVVAVSTDNTILDGLVANSNGAFKKVGKPFSKEPYGIGVKLGDDVFRDFINDTLEEMFENGDWEEAFEATLAKIPIELTEPPKIDRYKSGTSTATTLTPATTVTTTPGATTPTSIY